MEPALKGVLIIVSALCACWKIIPDVEGCQQKTGNKFQIALWRVSRRQIAVLSPRNRDLTESGNSSSQMDHRPSPPVAPDTDLRHMPGYMIDVQALLGSDLAALGDPAANWFAVLTWCASFHQVPAGSLPDDDTVLAYLVRLGRDVRTWKRMREKGAMRGWVKHSDGRFYHPVVTEAVLKLLGKSKAGKTAAEAKQARRNGQVTENIHIDNNDRLTTDNQSLHQNDNKGRERKEREGKGIDIAALGDAERDSQGSLIPVDPPKPAAKPKRSKARSALDPNWQLPEESRQYARDRGWVDRDIDFQFEKFRNFHTAKGNLMADWLAAWRTWVGNGYGPRGPSSPGSGGPPRTRSDSAIEGILEGMQAHDRFNS